VTLWHLSPTQKQLAA